WTPKARDVVCSRHFSPEDFRRTTHDQPAKARCLRANVVPTQLDCVEEYRSPRNTHLAAGSGVRTCCVCGCWRPLDETELIPSERLNFFPFPDDDRLRHSWLTACRQWNTHLTVSKESLVCENHFSLDNLARLLAGGLLSKSDVIPTEKTFAKLPAPIRLKKISVEVGSCRITDRAPGYKCCVPGCGNRAHVEGRLEKITFHVFPRLGTSSRFCEWMNRIRCSISWRPHPLNRVCSKHFSPKDFVEETAKGRQPRTSLLKKDVMPSLLQCVEKFRCPMDLSEPADLNEVRMCCVCGWWRVVSERYVRSELLTFFPFPADDEQRTKWVDVCREWKPDFVFSEGLLVCENHFQLDDLTWVPVNRFNRELKLRNDAIPSERCLRLLSAVSDPHSSDDVTDGMTGVPVDGFGELSSCDRAVDDGESGADSDAGDYEERDIMPADESAWDFDALDDDDSLMEVDYPDAPVLHITEPLCAPLRITRAVENGLPEDEDFSNVSDAGVQDMALALPFTAEEPVKEAPPLSSPRCALDDALIYCDCCHKFLPTPCWLHAASVCDEPVVPLAVGSLPKMLYLDVCDDSLTGKAVFTKEVIARHTVFGPLIAPVAMGDSEKALYFCITDKPRKHYELESDYACNWMKHVRFADSLQNSNLLVFSRASQVVFVTIKTVAPHEELKVWYSKQYLEMLETPGHGAVEDVKLETKDEGDEACVPLDDDNGQASEATPRDKNLIESTTVGTVSVSHLPMESESSLPVTVESDYRQTGENSRVRSKSKRTNKKRKFFTSNICSECNVRFRREDMLRLHQLGHTGYDDPPERECPECSKHFGDFPALLKHVDEHGTPLVQCPVCNETCSSSVVLLHLQRYHPGIERRKLYWERLNCDKCGLRFASNFLYRIHQLGHQDRECIDSIKITRKCPECGEMCESLEKLTEHVYAHGKLTKKCPVCNGYYPGLKKHIARCHPKYLARTRCSECGKEFGKAAALIKHMRAHRKKASLDSSTCQDCGLQFGKDSLFVLHKTSHGTTSYHAVFGTQKCPECDETFEETAELFQHIITHAVAAKKCPECGHWVGSLRMHLKRQHPGTPLLGHQLRYHTVTCLQCGLRFSTDLLRRIHECEHGGKELADDLRSRTACCECAEGFDSFDALVKHVKIHGRQTEECPVCKRRFSYLDNHIRHDHPGYQYKLIGRPEVQPDNDSDQRVKEVKYRNVTCNHCGLRFDSEAVCDLHRRQHADKGAMNDYRVDGDECPQCGESFQEFAALMAHVDSHGRRTDMCPVCGRWYAAVKQHIRRDHPDNYAESTAQENPGSDPPGTKEPDGYRCYKCGKMLPSRRSYDLHLKAHRIKEARFSSVTCNECGLRFISEVLCQLHKLRHDNDGCSNMELRNTKSCPECQEEFEEVELLADHVAAHGKATSKCPVCSCWFSQLRMHVQHEHPDSFRDYFVRRRRHSSAKDPDKTLVNESRRKQLPKRYSCTKCPKSFASIVHFQSHMKVNVSSAADNLTCDTCSLQFASQILCDLHKVTHGISADMDIVKICPECGEVFEQWEKLVEHVGTHGVKTAHINKISKCKICQQRFPSDCLLAQHAKEHENRESAQDAPSSSECVICRQRCADSSELQQHVKTHNGSRGFECPGCTATFPFYRLLSQHVTTHQHLPERKDFTCGICRATFSTDEDLQLHVFTHDAELTVKCHQCGEHFTDVADLYTHTALAHEASIVNGSDEEMNRKCWREIMSELPNEDAL
ncbi:uncharacterized protein LOC129585551, partial [Paramacrobiotus metropolitanus]|uniref:uncharacterized protein LOC129585551 n=1 Tax=Paramacrobiotus metropolitanus TaxID=2943436 RepID=UPI0024464169